MAPPRRRNYRVLGTTIAVAALPMGMGVYAAVHGRSGPDAVWAAIGTGVVLLLWYGTGILVRHREGRPVLKGYHPAYWAALPLLVIAGLPMPSQLGVVTVLAVLAACTLYFVGCQRTSKRYLVEAESAVTALSCPVHGKSISFDVQQKGWRQYVCVDGCCAQTEQAAIAAVEEVFG